MIVTSQGPPPGHYDATSFHLNGELIFAAYHGPATVPVAR
jgi:hypothetical protein